LTSEADLLAGVLAAPDDDAPRLVYSDWLEEHGRPERAEFIRLQCLIASLPEQHRAFSLRRCEGHGWLEQTCPECRPFTTKYRQELHAREVALLRAHRAEWFPLWDVLWEALETHWHGLSEPAEFRRGFVERLFCTAHDFLTHVDATVSAHPIGEVELATQLLAGRWHRAGGPRYTLSSDEGLGRRAIRVLDAVPCPDAPHAPPAWPTAGPLLAAAWPTIRFTLPAE
jgi:uncharacterized protein (TIGR02996 family)